MTTDTEIAAFFASYVEAFANNDADAIAELWEPVGLFPSPTGNFAMDRQAFRHHVVTLLDFYRQQGVVTPVGELLSATLLYPQVVEARMAYRMLGKGAETIAAWDHIYVLRRSDGHWRITLTISDGELAAWKELGAI
ncbi:MULTISPECIES: SgcJ/EcaC family oxidoreductase [unclassified Sphingomonas]|uniref:SgcJ/EcaC family oxidoreductase n=1 Tax=unclassified Sphingomonas TaxID=196159 RepID=UPI0007013993|nr:MULTISPECIES: SgcJ/EcaC family oxidoreductase [unclassified Sphingomonas]KQX19718.1 hypothetical protein ASD17_14120 [Sphingomonas sp. Root1294]KQY65919.1 hypothetical protein ASD39_17320 [Sphingomonas sp. Root50]KRB95514.1 hypothetical protein ASE22_02735 [Sphingomonas sp. Root720]